MLYEPENLGDTEKVQELIEILSREHARIGQAIEALKSQLDLTMYFVVPERPREGMIRFADGTSWNPGAGRGVYAFYSGVWNKL